MTQEKVLELLKQLGIELDLSEGMPAFWVNLGELQAFAQLVRSETLEEVADMATACDRRATPQGIACAIRIMK